jgi:heme oxygenase
MFLKPFVEMKHLKKIVSHPVKLRGKGIAFYDFEDLSTLTLV